MVYAKNEIKVKWGIKELREWGKKNVLFGLDMEEK